MGDPQSIPTREDVLAAAARIEGRVHRTPVFSSRSLSRMLGVDAVFKCENLQRVGAFKIRGATNAVLSIADEASAVATHSSGNHGAAIALAAKEAELACVVVIPQNTRPAKRDAIERYGATVVECGNTFDERQRTLKNVIDATGATYIPPFDDARIIAGAGTVALELLEEHDDLDQIWVPIGGGGWPPVAYWRRTVRFRCWLANQNLPGMRKIRSNVVSFSHRCHPARSPMDYERVWASSTSRS